MKRKLLAVCMTSALLLAGTPVGAESIIVGDPSPVAVSSDSGSEVSSGEVSVLPQAAETGGVSEADAPVETGSAAETGTAPGAGTVPEAASAPAAGTEENAAAMPAAAGGDTAGESHAEAAGETASSDISEASAPQAEETPAAERAAASGEGTGRARDAGRPADGRGGWYRSWKIHLLDMRDARKRRHKETILRSRLRVELLSDGTELAEGADVFYLCDNGADYVIAEQGGAVFVYQPCITRGGEYFLAKDTLNEAIIDHVTSLCGIDQLHSTDEFWNHILLRDAPQIAYRFSRDRPKDANGVMIVPYYNQGRGYFVNGTWLFEEWPTVTFDVNGHTMHEAGCGYFATAMALSYVLQRIVPPIEFKENGQYVAGMGSMVTIGTVSAASYGVDAYITGDFEEVLTALRNGQPVLEHVGSPPFTNEGHYILLVGLLPDGTIAVNDPGHMDNSYWYCGVSWPQEVILGAVKNINTAFTVFG